MSSILRRKFVGGIKGTLQQGISLVKLLCTWPLCPVTPLPTACGCCMHVVSKDTQSFFGGHWYLVHDIHDAVTCYIM